MSDLRRKPEDQRIRIVLVVSGLLGQRTFALLAREFFKTDDEFEIQQITVADDLTFAERLQRKLLCLKLWPDGLFGAKNLDVLRFRAELNAGLTAEGRFRRLDQRGFKADVVHYHFVATAYAALTRMERTPSITHIDTTQETIRQSTHSRLELMSYRLNARRDGQLFSRAKTVLALSHWAAGCVAKEYPKCKTPVAVHHHPVRLSAFDPGLAEMRRARAASNPNRKPVVLFIGGDFSRKGGELLLEAWKSGGFESKATLRLVTYLPETREPLPAGVELVRGIQAYTPEWQELWKEADVFVLPTRNEAFGLVFQEAAAAGLPCIGTNQNAIPELVLDGRTGFLLPVGDIQTLALRIGELLESAELRFKMGSDAQRYVERTASPESFFGLMRELSRNAVKRG